ncbi:hypothetical protein [Brevundimonas sp.]|uniref:hypothetical protein n=1 Tax=Brevundimonas sp. TaxID=1871086 RepID=UPI0028AC1D29|nr:hypothetical protein [Brevundimonas sp.]
MTEMSENDPTDEGPIQVRAQIVGHPWDLWGLSQIFDGDNALKISVQGAPKPSGAPSPNLAIPEERDRFARVGHDRMAQLSAAVLDRHTLADIDLRVIAEEAQALVTHVNGVAHLLDPEFRHVRLTGVTYVGKGGNGSKSIAEWTANKAFTGLGRHPSQAQFALSVIDASRGDPALSFVLEAWQLPLTWASLYLIWDRIAGTSGAAKGVAAKGYLTEAEIEDFRASANMARDFRTGIRHGSPLNKPRSAPLLRLVDGQILMQRLTLKWIGDRLAEGQG